MSKLDLAERWDRIKTTPGLKRDTIAMVALVVAGIAGAVIILISLGGGLPFEGRSIVKAEFPEVTSLNANAQPPVTIAGVEVGFVQDAETTDRGTAVVTMSIEPGYPMFDNARAILRPKNPLNDMQIELNPGGPPGAPMPDEGVIPASQTTRPIQPDEVLSHLDDRTQLAFTGLLSESDTALARASQQLPGGFGATADTLNRLRPAVDALKTRRETISELVTSLSYISQAVGRNDERLARLADVTQQTLGVLGRNDEALRASLDQMPGLSDDLRNALTSTQRLTKQLDPTLDNLNAASKELPPALDEFKDTVGELGKTVDAAAPVIAKAKPVVADLRPLVNDVDKALDDLLPVTDKLDKDTGIDSSYLTEIRAFVYNTRSVFGAGDAQGNIIRGHAVVPSGGFFIPQQPGFAPGEENGLVGSPQQGDSPTTPVPNFPKRGK